MIDDLMRATYAETPLSLGVRPMGSHCRVTVVRSAEYLGIVSPDPRITVGFPATNETQGMPLDTSGSKKSIGKNIVTEKQTGKPQKQAVAIALNVAKKGAPKKKGRPVSRVLDTDKDGY